MKLGELANELHISTETFLRFIKDFDLNLSECVGTDLEVKKDFENFARENISFLEKFGKNSGYKISSQFSADNNNFPFINIPNTGSLSLTNLIDNSLFHSSDSSFGTVTQPAGNYSFQYNYTGKKSNVVPRDFIGYRDLYQYISRTLEPFIDPSPLTDWGIHKTAGIILYGPPGSGKIFWATKIAEITGYRFEQVKRYYYGISFVDGNKTGFNDFLLSMMKEDKVVLFMEDFDKIMTQRSEQNSVSSCDEETKEIILHYIGHFENENLLMVGSAISLSEIDKELLAPGRFDVMIPVFPPNSKERLSMILLHITHNLTEDSLLFKILKKNNANILPFWKEISEEMKVFSNTMIIDFTQSLKKRIRNAYLKVNSVDINIDSNLVNAAFRDASAKLTPEYLTQVSEFINDVTVNNYDDFPLRIEELKAELDYYKIIETPRPPIGFSHNEEEK